MRTSLWTNTQSKLKCLAAEVALFLRLIFSFYLQTCCEDDVQCCCHVAIDAAYRNIW